MACFAAWSKFAVGSSSTRRREPIARALAIARRCLPPPESTSGESSRRAHRPS
ncbi:hypothetical protein ACFPRL_22135 [Pseudoclavibacter helvolus]